RAGRESASPSATRLLRNLVARNACPRVAIDVGSDAPGRQRKRVAGSAIQLPDDAQAVERQERVDVRDRPRVRRDQVDEAPGADDGGLGCAELAANRLDDAVDLTGEAVHEAGLQRGRGRL